MKNIKLILFILSIFLISCEGMDDKYSDMVNKSKIRYIGKCSDLTTKRGWNCVELSWKNSVDPVITKIKMKWVSDETIDSVLLDKGVETFTTPANLKNKNYEFILTSLDDNGHESLPINVFEKPFSEDDEMISSLRIIERKHFFIDDNLFMLLHNSDRNIESASIEYYEGESKKVYIVTDDDLSKKVIRINKVNRDKPVSVQSSLNIKECKDVVKFKPYKLDLNTISLSSDFIKNLKYNSDKSEVTKEFLATITTLYIDCDMTSLEDAAFLPNLEKIILGSKKYVDPSYVTSHPECLFKLSDKTTSEYILKVLQEVKSVKIEVFGNNYGIKQMDGLETTENPYPVLPEIEFFSQEEIEKWEVKGSAELAYSFKYEYLFDNDPSTAWKPIEIDGKIRTHNITINMKEVKDLHGVLFSQVDDKKYMDYMPKTIEVAISEDGVNWDHVFSYTNIELGISPSEKNLIKFEETQKAKYINITVTDKTSKYNNYVLIGDFIPF